MKKRGKCRRSAEKTRRSAEYFKGIETLKALKFQRKFDLKKQKFFPTN